MYRVTVLLRALHLRSTVVAFDPAASQKPISTGLCARSRRRSWMLVELFGGCPLGREGYCEVQRQG